MNPVRGFFLLARHAFGRCFRGGRLVTLLVLAALPVGMAGLQASVSGDLVPGDFVLLVAGSLLQFVIPLGALFLGVGAIGDEIDGRTITYLFTRPLPRPVFLLARVCGVFAAFGLLLSGSVFAVAAVFGRRMEFEAGEVAGTVAIALGGALVYTVFFATLRVLLRRALLVGFLLVFVVEGFLSKMPLSGLAKCSVWHHLWVLQVDLFGGTAALGRGFAGISPEDSVSGSITVLLGILVVAAALGCYLMQTREVRVPAAVA